MKLREIVIVLIAVSVSSLISNALGSSSGLLESLPGVVILALIALGGWTLARVVPLKLPAVVWTVIIGCVLTCPGVPGSHVLSAQVSKVDFVALCTPVLAYAGIAFGKDLKSFLTTGWKLVLVAMVVFSGVYFGSSVIAHFVLKLLD